MDQTYFTIEQCEDGGLYYLQAFHFRLGVYIEEVQGLVGIRRKLGISYLFIEYHFDYSVVIGTAQPITLLGDCPDAILRSYTGSAMTTP